MLVKESLDRKRKEEKTTSDDWLYLRDLLKVKVSPMSVDSVVATLRSDVAAMFWKLIANFVTALYS